MMDDFSEEKNNIEASMANPIQTSLLLEEYRWIGYGYSSKHEFEQAMENKRLIWQAKTPRQQKLTIFWNSVEKRIFSLITFPFKLAWAIILLIVLGPGLLKCKVFHSQPCHRNCGRIQLM